MRFVETVRRAGRSLRQAKARTLLTSLAIGVGAFTITLALAAGEGGRQYAADIVSSNTDVKQLYVQPKQDNLTDPTKPREYIEGPSMSFGGGFSQQMLSGDDIKKLENIAHVEEVTPIYNAAAEYVTREGQKKYQAGIEPHNPAIKQDILAGDTKNLGSDGVILPSSFAEALGWSQPEQAIGRSIDVVIANSVSGETEVFKLKVVAVTKSSLMSASASTGLMVDQKTVAEMYKVSHKGTPLEDAFLGAIVVADDEANVGTIQEKVEKQGFLAQTAKDLMGFIFQFIDVLMGILIGFGALAVLTSVFGIINTQYISVLERTQQIGLMKALGMRSRDISKLFRYEAAWIGLLGGIIGVLLAWLVTLLNPVISNFLELEEGTRLLRADWVANLVLVAVLMLVAVISGYFPSRKAAKLDPIDALRTE